MTDSPQLLTISCLLGKFNVEIATSKKDDDEVPSRTDFRSYAISLVVDYLFVVLPVLLIVTVLADWAYIFTVLIILLLLFCISAKRLSSYLPFKGEQHSSSPRTTISSYRVLVVYMNWKATLKSISPLLFLGFGRLITTTGVDYQVGSSTQHLFCICYFGVKSHKKFFCTVQPGVCYAGLCTEFSGLSIQMAYSLQANVLTGLVNLSMDTLSAAPVTAVGVLLGYSFALSAVTALVWFCGIKLKFW
ncbi:hypothetical protein GW17_00023276 [Ensete ventricosum]|nr:hypothetical protein GW17_00023276 [Ensete ventricosum]